VSLWIKRDTELPRHRKTYLLADLLSQGSASLLPGRDLVAWRAIAMCLLEDVWAYAAEHCPDGSMDAVHPEALKDAVRVWLEGTEWLRTDVRELLIRSGHLDRTEAGLRLHGWLEWTGTDSMRLANDRQRKRLARADASNRPGRTRPSNKEGRGRGQTALAKPSQEEKNQAKRTAAADYATRCVIAVNTMLEQKLAGVYRPLVADVERETAATWEAKGIRIELVEQVLAEVTLRFHSRPHNRQPATLRYFDGAILEAHAADQATASGQAFRDPIGAALAKIGREEAPAA